MKKRIFLFILFFILLISASCGDKTTTTTTTTNITTTEKNLIPTDYYINEGVVYFTEAEGIVYKLICNNLENNSIVKRVVSNATSLYDLDLEYGDYHFSLECSQGTSVQVSDYIAYTIEDDSAIKEINGQDLISLNLIKWIGRNEYVESLNANMMYHSGSGFTIKFKGTSLTADFYATNGGVSYKRPYLAIVLDEDYDNPTVISLNKAKSDGITLVTDLEYKEHTVTVLKRSESLDSHYGLKKIYTDGKFLDKVEDKARFIEIIGDSTIAGYGNETKKVNGTYEGKQSSNSNILKTFAFLTAQNLDADYSIVCASGWGLTGSIYTTPNTVNMFDAYKKMYMSYENDKHVYSTNDYNFVYGRNADAIIISLGTNDLYYIEAGLTISSAEMEARRQAFINKYEELVLFLNTVNTNTQIFMIYGAMGESRMYSTVENAYEQISKTYSNVHIIKLYGDQGAVDYHPSVNSHKLMANTVTNKIKEVLNW